MKKLSLNLNIFFLLIFFLFSSVNVNAENTETEKNDLMEKWEEVYILANKSSDLYKEAKSELEKLGYFEKRETELIAYRLELVSLSKTATSIKEWENIYYGSEYSSELRKLAKSKLQELGYYQIIATEQELIEQDLINFSKTAKTVKDWFYIYQVSKYGSDLKDLSRKELVKLGFFSKDESLSDIHHKEAQKIADSIKK